MVLPRRVAIEVFLVFACAYFLSALLRGVTGTLAPALAREFALHARDLGLLSGGYFLGFSLTQLPLGRWLDRHGPRTVQMGFLGVAVLGCLVFAAASSLTGLLLGRMLIGAGVSACLMAPLTGYRHWFTPAAQLRANSWMLMTGSLGMVASTLPVQWLLPLVGWRPVFWGLAALLLLAMVGIAVGVPRWNPSGAAPDIGTVGKTTENQSRGQEYPGGYAMVWRNPYFQRLLPLAFFTYGGMVAMQTLWAGPWIQNVGGQTPLEAAAGLFWISATMLCAFWGWGMVSPWLHRQGLGVTRLMAWGLPISLVVLAAIVALGPRAGAGAWALFCASSTFVAQSQPALAMTFPQALAGRALSAYNLVVFVGVFVVQWGVGLAIDGFMAAGLATVDAYRAAVALYLVCNSAAYAWFMLRGRGHNGHHTIEK